MHGRGQGDVLAVLPVALQVLRAAGARKGGGGAVRRQREGLDARGVAAAGVVVDADEDGVGVLVGNRYALLQGEEVVPVPGHDDLVTALQQALPHLQGDGQVAVFLGGVGADRAFVVPAVPRIQHHGGDVGVLRRELRTQNGVDQLLDIRGRDVEQPRMLADGEGEDEVVVVDVDILLAAAQ